MPNRHSSVPHPAAVRIRRGYFECRHGQLHVHHAIPGGGGFEEGTPLLILHPAGGCGRIFIPLLGALGRERSAFAPDLPGFGESDSPSPLTIPGLAAALGDFLDTMRLRQVDVIGCGLGAHVALELLGTHSAVRRVVLAALSTAQIPPVPRSTDSVDDFLRASFAGAQADCGAGVPLAAVIATCGERLSHALEAAHAAALERVHPLGERLRGVTQPLLLLHAPDHPHGFGLTAADLPAHTQRAPCAGLAALQAAGEPLVAAIQKFLTA